ncbi:Cu+-exporting ATPase [Tranquillimonas rosea]|uniref:Cu+-exporting ATPase n=1 Tax=Tranquillimonas rosea TaxID=641238 RepID=A0A1H9RHJ9_9RHOB|nr:heavy metal translocating P-type ATPase [Tranquillimonas rosea]SER72117.1 Cu+-exporting ATPase [Tranquillimonas rosea]
MSHARDVTLSLPDLSCAGCVNRAERALTGADGVAAAHVNLATRSAAVTLADGASAGPALEALRRAGYPARLYEDRFPLDGLTCASCVARAERALGRTPGVTGAEVNLATRSAHVTATTLDALSAARRSVAEAGYPPAAETDTDRTLRDDEDEVTRARRTTILAAALTVPVVVLEMGGHAVPGFRDWLTGLAGAFPLLLLEFALTSLVLAWPGREFFARGVPALLRGAPEMNALVAIGTFAAWGYSTVAVFAPGLLPEGSAQVYFEAAATIVTLILLGRWLEARARGRAGEAVRALIGLQPRTARVDRNGTVTERPIEEIAVGDIVHLRPGERVAVDGTVTGGSSHLDESSLTGEPIPVEKAEGDTVTAGTVNGQGAVTYRATRVGSETRLAQIVRMVEAAQGARLPVQDLVNRITGVFVPAVLAIATVTVAVWLLAGAGPSAALVAGVSVLIVACPCAMGLAVPVSIMVATGRGAEMGLIFRKGDALQRLGEVDTIALDKTGTLTEGRPEVVDIALAPGADRRATLAAIGAVETASEHPLSRAIVRAAQTETDPAPAVTDFTALTGAGVSASVEGRRVLIGARRLMQREGIDLSPLPTEIGPGRTPVYAAIDDRAVALIQIADRLRASTPGAIKSLRAAGIEVAMITGDDAATAQAVADSLGIDKVTAEVAPEGKVAALEDLRRDGRLAFVGDGINDAPALATADLGIAIGTGTDVAIESADVVLMGDDLAGLVRAVDLSRATMRNIRENLVWAFGYNVALIPLAAGVLFPAFGLMLSPVLAAGAMALSSLFVVSNALRLRRFDHAAGPAPTGPLKEVTA